MQRPLAAPAAAALAQAAQTPVLLAAGIRLPLELVIFHIGVVAGLFLLAGMLAGSRSQLRIWAGVCALLPMVLAMWPLPAVNGYSGFAGLLLLLALSAVAIVLYGSLPLGRGMPLLAAPAGALLGTAIATLRAGVITGPTAAAALTVAALLLFAAYRLRHSEQDVALPSLGTTAVLLTVGLLVSAAPALLPTPPPGARLQLDEHLLEGHPARPPIVARDSAVAARDHAVPGDPGGAGIALT
jgi:hypothetical protein